MPGRAPGFFIDRQKLMVLRHVALAAVAGTGHEGLCRMSPARAGRPHFYQRGNALITVRSIKYAVCSLRFTSPAPHLHRIRRFCGSQLNRLFQIGASA